MEPILHVQFFASVYPATVEIAVFLILVTNPWYETWYTGKSGWASGKYIKRCN